MKRNIGRMVSIAAVVVVALMLLAWPVSAQTTLSGDINVSETAGDSESFTYETEGSGVSTASLTLTGVENTAPASANGSYAPGDSGSLSIGGNTETTLTATMTATGSKASQGDTVWSDTSFSNSVYSRQGYDSQTETLAFTDADSNTLRAYNGTSGEEKWTDSSVEVGAVSAANGRLFLQNGDFVTAFDADTGAQLWEYDALNFGTSVEPMVADGSVFVSDDGTTVRLSQSDGSVEWSAATGTNNVGSIAVSESLTVVAGEEVVAFDRATGAEEWRFSDVSIPNLHADGDLVYLGESTGPNNVAELIALNAGDGTEAWRFSGQTSDADVTGIQSNADKVYTTDGENYITAIDKTNGAEEWDYSSGSFFGGITLADGTLFASSNDQNEVQAFNAADGQQVWTASVGGRIDAAVRYSDGRVYTVSEGGVYAFEHLSPTIDPELSVNGSPAVSASGELPIGKSRTATVNVQSGTAAVDYAATAGNVAVNYSWTERTISEDPTVTIDSAGGIQTASYTGSLAAGDSVDLSDQLSVSQLGGPTTVTVGLASSGSGPEPSVDMEFSHDASFSDVEQVGQYATVDESTGPTVTEPSPADGGALYDSDATVGALIDGGTLPIGGEMRVEIASGGSTELNTTITEAQRLNTSLSTVVGGRNEWTVTATDQTTGDTVAQTFGFRAPAELEIRDETTPGSLLTSANVTIELYVEGEEGRILQRETSNGVIDMSGLPADQPFIAVANAPDYEPRRIYVESILEQQTIYLIPSTADFVEPEFELQDFTGRFPSDETVLQVERPINGEWATIQGDRFGATGAYSVTLVRDQEHRLTLVNLRTGDEKSIGRFTPALDSAETIEVTESEAVVLVEGMPEIVINPSTRTLPALAGQSISGDITAGDAPLEEVSVEIRFDDGASTETLATETHDSPDSVRFDETLNLSGYSDGQVVVEVGWIAQNGESASRTFEFSLREPISASRDTTFGLLPTLVTVPDRLAGDADPSTAASALTFASIFLTVIVTAVATVRMRLSTETAAAVALFSLSGFWVIGWLSGAIVFVATITGVALAGLRRGI